MMKFYHFIKNAIFSLLAKQTVGVRMLLINEGRILLVKHTYRSGWYTIGGAVDPGETPSEAMERELKEEVGATLTSKPKLFSIYYSRNEKRDDYIIFYVNQGCIQEKVISSEIAEQRWFPLDQLPDELSPATLRRIQEYLGEREIDERW